MNDLGLNQCQITTREPAPGPEAREIPDATAAEEYVKFTRARMFVPHDGRPPSPQAMVRWATKGTRAKDGRRIKLQAVKTPAGWLTKRSWLSDFVLALTAAESSTRPALLIKERAEAAGSWLRSQGF